MVCSIIFIYMNNSNTKILGFFLAVSVIGIMSILFIARSSTNKAKSPTTNSINIVSANQVSMQLLTAHTEANGYRVEVCYDLPQQRDWQLTYSGQPQGAMLYFDEVEAHPIEEGTMYWRYDENGKIMQRCQYLFFFVKIRPHVKEISLVIKRLYARAPNQPDYCLEISQKMAERIYQIAIDCVIPNGFDYMVYTLFPTELLSMDPVFKNILNDVDWEFYEGPWSFTFPVNPP
jgi:hypothetical protein